MSSLTITGLFMILLLAIQAASQELNSTLHSTLYGVQIAYVDEMIVFTCVVRGSDNMAWTSEEYIGTGGQQLPFAAAEPEGTVRHAIGNDQTIATLVTAINTGEVMIVSELRITITSTHPVASIQCISRGADIITMNSTRFQLVVAPFIDCDKPSVCPGDIVTCTCATGNSNTQAWMINGTGVQFISNDPVSTRRNISNSFAMLTENSDVNGIRVIISNLIVNASSEDIVLTCRNIDRIIATPLIVPIAETCPMIMNPSDVTPTENGNTGASDSSIIAAVVIPVITVFIAVIVTMVIICLMYKSVQARLKAQDEKIDSLKKDNETQDKKIGSLEKVKETQEDEIKSLKETMEEKENNIESLERDLTEKTQLVGQSGEELMNLQNVLKAKDDAVRGLRSKMKEEWKAALQILEENMKEKQATMLLSLKKKFREAEISIDQALKEKETVKIKSVKLEIEGGPSQEVKTKMSVKLEPQGGPSQEKKAKTFPRSVSAESDEIGSKTKVEGVPAKHLSSDSEMKEERTIIVNKLKDLLVTEIDEVLKKEGLTADTRKGESLEGAPRTELKESSVDNAARQFENRMDAEVAKILKVGKEPMVPGQQESSQGYRPSSKVLALVRDPTRIPTAVKQYFVKEGR